MSEAPVTTDASQPGPRPRRRWVAPVVVLIVLALLGVALVVADGVAEEAFESEAATRVQETLGAAEPPQVDATGRPFLPQLVRGDVEHLDLHADRTTLAAGEDSLTVERLDVQIDHLRSPDRFTTTTADQLSGSADVGYAEISRLAGREIEPGESSGAGTRWVLSMDSEVLGVDVPIQVSGIPVLDGSSGRQLTLTDVQLSVADYDVPQRVADEIIAALLEPVPLQLPLDLGADSITSTADGLTIDFSGTDVPLS